MILGPEPREILEPKSMAKMTTSTTVDLIWDHETAGTSPLNLVVLSSLTQTFITRDFWQDKNAPTDTDSPKLKRAVYKPLKSRTYMLSLNVGRPEDVAENKRLALETKESKLKPRLIDWKNVSILSCCCYCCCCCKKGKARNVPAMPSLFDSAIAGWVWLNV